MRYQTIKVNFEENICFIQLNRPKVKNAINDEMIKEINEVLEMHEKLISIVVLKGLNDDFCNGGDFQDIKDRKISGDQREHDPEPLYNLWVKLATGPYITISLVRGRVNAGGMGFVAASDIVLADETAQFSLSELLFGLFPACVLPFLVRRIGFQKANYLTLMTQPIKVEKAYSLGLIDSYDKQSEVILRKHILRLKRLSKEAIKRYKQYMSDLFNSLSESKVKAIEANKEIFSDTTIIDGIVRYTQTKKFPWMD